jgi:hypothetical protein
MLTHTRTFAVLLTCFFFFFSFLFCAVQWGQKQIRRNTTGTGRMKHLRSVQRRFRNGFREQTHVWRPFPN